MENQVILALKNNKLLRNILFDDLNLENIKGQLLTKSEGEILFRESDDSESLYLVVKGEINLLKKRGNQKTESFVFGENDFLGADEFLQQDKRRSTAVALRDSYIIALSKSEVDSLIEQSDEIIANIFQSVDKMEGPGGDAADVPGDIKKVDFNSIEPDVSGTVDEQPAIVTTDDIVIEGLDDIILDEAEDIKAADDIVLEETEELKVTGDIDLGGTEDLKVTGDIVLDGVEDINASDDIVLEGLDDIDIFEQPVQPTPETPIPEEPSPDPIVTEERSLSDDSNNLSIDEILSVDTLEVLDENIILDENLDGDSDLLIEDELNAGLAESTTGPEPENESILDVPPAVTPGGSIVIEKADSPITEESAPVEDIPQEPVIRKTKFSGSNNFELLEKINDAAQLVNSNIKIDKLLQNIVKVASDLTSADRGTLYLMEKEKNELWSKIAMGNSFEEIKLKVGEGIAGWVAEKGETINLENAQEDSRFNDNFDKISGYVTKSMICFPIKDRNNEICGVLQLLNSNNGKFSHVDEELLEALSYHAAMALQNAELVEQLLKGERILSLGKMANFLIQDIKKPIMVSKRYAEHLKAKELPEESKKVVDMLLDQLDHIAELVNSTSNYSEGQIVSRSHPRSMNEMMKEFVARIESYVHTRNCKITSDFEDDVNVEVSEKQLYQAFQHIVKNACDAMPDGGDVIIFTEKVDNDITIVIKDSGLGISATLHEKIFEPFMSHGKKEGTGLGLSIAKKIIEEHNGSISVTSEVGEGAKFIITLPIVSA